MKTHGPDSFVGVLASTMWKFGNNFYIVAVYFGSVGIKNTRHAIPGLIADLLESRRIVYCSNVIQKYNLRSVSS